MTYFSPTFQVRPCIQQRFDAGFVAVQQNIQIRIAFARNGDATDNHSGATVAPHSVKRNCTTFSQNGSLRSFPGDPSLKCSRGVDYFAAIVVAAFTANVVRALQLTAFLTFFMGS